MGVLKATHLGNPLFLQPTIIKTYVDLGGVLGYEGGELYNF